MSAYYTTEIEACSLLDLSICEKFVVNFNIRSCSIPVGKQDCYSKVQKESLYKVNVSAILGTGKPVFGIF